MAKKKDKKLQGPIVFDPPHRGFMVQDQDISVVLGTSFPEATYGVDILWDQLVGPVSVDEFRRFLTVLKKVDEELTANGV